MPGNEHHLQKGKGKREKNSKALSLEHIYSVDLVASLDTARLCCVCVRERERELDTHSRYHYHDDHHLASDLRHCDALLFAKVQNGMLVASAHRGNVVVAKRPRHRPQVDHLSVLGQERKHLGRARVERDGLHSCALAVP